MRGIGGILTGLALALAGCNGKELTRATCQNDADCGSGQRCERSTAPGEKPQIMAVCNKTPCTTTDNCSDGLVCGPTPPGSQTPGWGGCGLTVCIPACSEGSCGEGQLCRSTGLCELSTCEDPGGVACPDHWLCDLDPANLRNQSAYPRGSTVEDPSNYLELVRGGCVRIPCDEDDGYVCAEYYACETATATDPSGCAPIPCAVGGHCESDRFICSPTSSAPHSAYYDEFGCVARNCEEGLDCEELTPHEGVEYCDPSAAKANSDGCVIRKCDEGNWCVETFTCDPESPNADTLGCVAPDGSQATGSTGAGGMSGSAGGAGETAATGGASGRAGEASGAGGDVMSGGGSGGGTGGGASGDGAMSSTGGNVANGGAGGTTGGSGGTAGSADGAGEQFGPGRCVAR